MALSGEVPDGDLVGKILDGDDSAFRELMRRYREKIQAICLRILRNRTEAEEAAQDCFVKAYFNLAGFDRSRDLPAWLAAIALNVCRDKLRERARFRRVFKDVADSERDASQAQGSEDHERRERIKAVEEAIERLPDKLREVLVLRAYGDYSYEQIAEALKIEIGTVMSRLHRSRAKLTELLRRGKEK